MAEFSAWLESLPLSPLVARTCQACLASDIIQRHCDENTQTRFSRINTEAVSAWVESTCLRLSNKLQVDYVQVFFVYPPSVFSTKINQMAIFVLTLV